MSDFLDPLKLGILVLFFIPGFIFIQGIERQLLRKHKPQFEKTFEIVLASAVIWILALPLYTFVFGPGLQNNSISLWQKLYRKKTTVKTGEFITENTKNTKGQGIVRERKSRRKIENHSESIDTVELKQVIPDFVKLFAVASLLAFFGASLWGFFRKKRFLDSIGKTIIGRNWHPSVKFRFLYENTGKMVEVQVENIRYIGTLASAPDVEEDQHIIILNPMQVLGSGNLNHEQDELEFKSLSTVREILIRIEDIKSIRVHADKTSIYANSLISDKDHLDSPP